MHKDADGNESIVVGASTTTNEQTATSLVNVFGEANGIPSFENGSTSLIEVTSEGDGQASGSEVEKSDGSTSLINVFGEAGGTPSFENGATDTIQIIGEAGGTPSLESGSTSLISVSGEAGGVPSFENGSTSTVQILGEADGTPSFENGSTSLVQILGEGSGQVSSSEIQRSDGSTSIVNVFGEASGTPSFENGSTSLVSITGEGSGESSGSTVGTFDSTFDSTFPGGTSTTTQFSSGSTSLISVSGEADGTPSFENGATSLVQVIGEAGGQSSGSSAGQISLTNNERDRFTVSAPSSSLLDYVFIFDLSTNMSSKWWDAVDTNDGTKIKVAKANGEELPFEIVGFNTASQAGYLYTQWTGSLESSASSQIDVWAPSSSYASYDVTASFGRNNVWNKYRAVYHLEASSTPYLDSTGNGNDSVAEQNTINTTGLFGNAKAFSNGNGEINLPSMSFNGTQSISVTSWIYPKSNNGWHVLNGTKILTRLDNGNLDFFLNDFTSGDSTTTTNTASLNEWNYSVGSFDGTTLLASLNASGETSTTPSGTYSDNDAGWKINTTTDGREFSGSIDEVRIAEFGLSLDWIDYEFRNYKNVSNFFGTGTWLADQGTSIVEVTGEGGGSPSIKNGSTSLVQIIGEGSGQSSGSSGQTVTTFATPENWTNPSSSLDVYVGLINLSDMPQSWWDAVDTHEGNRGRIRIDNAETTELASEWVGFNTASQAGYVWFKWSGSLTTSNNDVPRVYVPTSSNTAYSSSHPSGSNNVWTSYAGVWHFEDGTDSTGNGHNLSASGSVTLGGTAGKINNATFFDGDNDFAVTSDSPDFDPNDIIVEQWINTDSLDGSFKASIEHELEFIVQTTPDEFEFSIRGADDVWYSAITTNVNPALNTWYHIVGIFDNANDIVKILVNGVQEASASIGVNARNTTADLHIGNQGFGDARFWSGSIDETRLRTSVIGTNENDRANLSYLNQNDPASFWGTWSSNSTTIASGSGGSTSLVQVIGEGGGQSSGSGVQTFDITFDDSFE